MANAFTAIQSARICLGDLNGITWTDSILMLNLQEAYRSLLLSLRVYSINVIKNQTAILTVPINTLTLNTVTGYPTNLINPIALFERIPGEDMDSFEDMIQTSFPPITDQQEDLIYWSWIGEQIKLVGATSIKEVLLRFEGGLTPPVTVNDPLNFIMAEQYLGPKTAAIALNAISKDGKKWDDRAEMALFNIMKANVTEDQRPVRRRAYRGLKGSYGPSPIRGT